ncbi:MAG: ABC transporter permease [Oscillospiraceae bacterium]|nr:ABC transporter permease [Oscillospiraceae bacterium]
MKHLISLSFKYIRRQKLRSALTFLCIMLAVFIFNTNTAYLGSTIATLINFEKHYGEGAYHVKLDGALPYCEDLGKVGQLLENHVAVEDHFFSCPEELWGLSTRDEQGYLRYLDVQFDNGASQRVDCLRNNEISGNRYVMYNVEWADKAYGHLPVLTEENSVYLSSWMKDLGYEVGDTITMTVTPMKARLSEDSEQVKAARKLIAETQTYYVMDDPPELANDNVSLSDYDDGGSMMNYLTELYGINEILFSEEISGSPCTFTVKIAGFQDQFGGEGDTATMEFWSYPVNDLRLDELVSGENADFLTGSEIVFRSWKSAAVRISDRIDFDDGVMMLLEDMGLEPKHYYDLAFNDTLLSYEMRSANAISAILPLIAAILILTLVAWLITRFVIDNAFEISVQERSAQFAALRIMGASRAQLVALIFTEAIFYCLTAVPIGVLAAFGACKAVMDLVGGSLFPIFEFDVNWWITLIGIVISLSGILISAYTSAMWAARKLSPMEALQFGKPRKKSEKVYHRKSVLNHKSFGFVLDYTMKNLSRTKSRYVISTVAMALGIVMFSFSLLGVNYVSNAMKASSNSDFQFDYDIVMNSFKPGQYELVNELLADSGAFSKIGFKADTYIESDRYEEEMELLRQMMPDKKPTRSWGTHLIKVVSEENFDKYLASPTGMTYEEFCELGGALVYVSSGGAEDEYEYDANGWPIRKRADGYWTYQELGFAQPPVITDEVSGFELPVVGSVCFDFSTGFAGESTLLIGDPSILPENVLSSMNGVIRLYVDGHQNHEAAQAAIDAFTQKVSGCMLIDQYMDNTGQISFFNAIFKILGIFVVSVWLVGILTMVNSINTSVLNRQKELLMLRSVGMTKRQLQLSVMLEGVLYCLVSTVIGLLIGVSGYSFYVDYANWHFTGLSVMQVFILPVMLTVIGTILLNLLIAVLAAVPALDSLSKRMK